MTLSYEQAIERGYSKAECAWTHWCCKCGKDIDYWNLFPIALDCQEHPPTNIMPYCRDCFLWFMAYDLSPGRGMLHNYVYTRNYLNERTDFIEDTYRNAPTLEQLTIEWSALPRPAIRSTTWSS